MSRIAEKVSIDFLYNKIMEYSFDDPSECEYKQNEFPMCPYDLIGKNSVLEKDLSKVQFDTENYNCGTGGLNGFHTLGNGLTFVGVRSGGDWEIPIFFIVYWDGKNLRGYIPSHGNPYNPISMTALHSEGEVSLKEKELNDNFAKKTVEFINTLDIDTTDDILSKIKDIFDKPIPKDGILCCSGYEEKVTMVGDYIESILTGTQNFGFNWDEIEKDIRNRIQVI